MRRNVKQSGLTLIEILVVLLILAILAVAMKFGMTRLQSQNNERAVRGLFTLLDNALYEYQAVRGTFPDPNGLNKNLQDPNDWTIHNMYVELETVSEAREIVEGLDVKWARDVQSRPDDPRWVRDYRRARCFDPWGWLIIYSYQDGDTFPLLRSAGPDRRHNTPDDILNR